MGSLAAYLRILAVVLALGLTVAILFGPSVGAAEDLALWLLMLPIVFAMVATRLASRARSANITCDGSYHDKFGDER